MKNPFPLTAAVAAVTLLNLPAADKPEPLARVGDIEITAEQIKPRLDALSETDRAALAQNPDLLNQFVRSLIVQQMLLRKAELAKFDREPEIEAQLAQLREKALAQGYLASVSQPEESYPSDDEVKAAYEENKAALKVPKQYHIAQIFVALPEDANKETTAMASVKVDEVKASLAKAGSDFAAIARARSEEPESAARGGELGWLTLDQIQPGIREELAKLRAGEVSDPIRLGDGVHFVKVLETKEAYIPELGEVRDALALRMRAAKAQQNSQAYLAGLVEESPVAINEIKLSELLPRPKGKSEAPSAQN